MHGPWRHLVHIELPCSRYRYISIFTSVTSRITSWCRRNRYCIWRIKLYWVPVSDLTGTRNATWVYEVMMIPLESGTVWKTRCCVRRHWSQSQAWFPNQKNASSFIFLFIVQRYTYRLFLIIFGSWKLYEVYVRVRVLKVSSTLTFWRRIFFQILAYPVFKMWVIQKPNKVALWNKRHF